MKKLLFLFAFLLTITFLSCKKKEKDPEPTPTPTTLNYYGMLNSYETVSVFGSTVSPASGGGNAIFPSGGFIESTTYPGAFMGVAQHVGTVSLNSVAFKADNQSGSIIYQDTTGNTQTLPIVWSVSGGSGISAFTYTDNTTRPTYSGYAAIPDTVKTSAGFSFNVTGLSPVNEIVVTVYSNGFAQKGLPGNSATIGFSSSELSSLTSSSFAYIMISFSKYSIQNVGGKDFKFKVGHQVFKQIIVE